ncbi:hypothetical protein G6F40_016399 [Rhizopus arrhizus]|nr:hypothetical protein G6F40_016399 [Rhizopus arrhizus]
MPAPTPTWPTACASRWQAMRTPLYDPLAHAQDTQGEHGGGLTAPMPGKIISISVKARDPVAKGQPLLVMEAMKMEHTISAPADGRVGEVFYGVGDQVTEGAELVSIE